MIRHFTGTLIQKKEIAENTTEMTFRVDDPGFAFKAGQYVSVEGPSLEGASVTDRYHDFSIASSPSNPNEISISFRSSQSIFKTAILALPVGGVVNIDGPKGVLTLPESPHTPLIFVAGGIGITPLLSMVRFATEAGSPQKITLLYCNAKAETTAYRQELRALASQNPHFTFEEFLGIPTKEIFIPTMERQPNAMWYIVGAPLMVEKVEQFLFDSGIMDTQVRTEEFSGYMSK
ncbi:MAG: FAD-dependent oxidoreductase [Candidatus Pacebacteria bacterium]|jgi:ferredoxin-NADP reductase|nr:FAD-dependent oxidoreductase [Candidatus Paceibacterota bacterium]